MRRLSKLLGASFPDAVADGNAALNIAINGPDTIAMAGDNS